MNNVFLKVICKCLIGAIIAGSIYTNVYGQTLPAIQLDRPDQTECPYITPKNYIQVENGITLIKEQGENRIINHPSSLWKYGINDRMELRLITEFLTQKNNGKTTNGLAPVTIGFKTTLLEQKGILPKTSFIGHITSSQWGTKAFHTPFIAPSFRFTMQHILNNSWSLSYNLGAEWDGIHPNATYIYTLATGVSLTEKLGFYGELYGFLPELSMPDHRFDGGFTYLLHPDCMIDLSGGAGLFQTADTYYISFGFSFRFDTKRHKK